MVTKITYDFEKTSNEKKCIHYIAFRIKYGAIEDHDRFKKFIHGYKQWFIVSENEQSNHHLQGVIVVSTNPITPKSAIDQFRNKLRALGWFNGNGDYSLKQGDGKEKYLRYLCKGDSEKSPPIVYHNNILLEEKIKSLHLKYYQEKDSYKTTEAHKKYYKIMSYKLPKTLEEKSESIQMMCKIILYHDANNLLIPDDYSLKKMWRTYMFKSYPEEQKAKKALSLAQSILES